LGLGNREELMGACGSCGKEVGAGTAFCPACGAPVVSGAGPEVAGGSGTAAAAMPAVDSAAAARPLATNVAGALAYLAGFITGIIFLVVDPYKNNSFIRFHAFQSIFFNVAWIALWIGWSIVSAILTPITGGIFGLVAIPVILLMALTGFCVWAFLMYQAYQQKLFRLPLIGKFAAQQAGVGN
jgi:uncharacterized membrane protein